jgi:hypothetical protein
LSNGVNCIFNTSIAAEPSGATLVWQVYQSSKKYSRYVATEGPGWQRGTNEKGGKDPPEEGGILETNFSYSIDQTVAYV